MSKSFTFDKKWIEQISPDKKTHKYNRGVVSFVMGSQYPGACLSAARAAQASGAGYVKIHTDEQLVQICRVTWPDLVFVSYSDSNHLIENLNKDEADAFSIGSGWSENPKAFQDFVSDLNRKIILDGGLLKHDFLKNLKTSHENLILTPHEGELKEISGVASKTEAVDWYAKTYKGALIAKGGETVIAQKNERKFFTEGSPYLATAGTGDVLAGLVTSFAGQGLSSIEASQFAVYIHALAAKRLGWGLTPTTLISEIGEALKSLELGLS
jgi:hydroxyethylthiazole kinase-like uncharacterized protein yjeF